MEVRFKVKLIQVGDFGSLPIAEWIQFLQVTHLTVFFPKTNATACLLICTFLKKNIL